jgi:hypothetical protein
MILKFPVVGVASGANIEKGSEKNSVKNKVALFALLCPSLISYFTTSSLISLSRPSLTEKNNNNLLL